MSAYRQERIGILSLILAKHLEYSTLWTVQQRNNAERKRLVRSQEFLHVGMALHTFCQPKLGCILQVLRV